MRRSDHPSTRPPQIRSTTWSSCSLTSSRTRSRAARRPTLVLIFRRLAIESDMLQRWRDPVAPAESNCSPIFAKIGRDRALEESLQGLVDLKNTFFTGSTRSVAAAGQCIKSTFRDFSRQDSFFRLRKPRQTQTTRGAFRIRDAADPPPLRLRSSRRHKSGSAGWRFPRSAARSWGSRDVSQGPMLPLPLVIAFQANTGVLSASFSRDRSNFWPGARLRASSGGKSRPDLAGRFIDREKTRRQKKEGSGRTPLSDIAGMASPA